MCWIFTFPINGEDPPPRAIIDKLKAIDAARKRLFTLGMAGFIRAPNMRNVVPFLYSIHYRILKKAFLGKETLSSGGVFVRRRNSCRYNSFIISTAWNHARSGIKKGAKAVPISPTGWAGNYVIYRRNYVIDGIHVTWLRG